jgi:hypothetical protein
LLKEVKTVTLREALGQRLIVGNYVIYSKKEGTLSLAGGWAHRQLCLGNRVWFRGAIVTVDTVLEDGLDPEWLDHTIFAIGGSTEGRSRIAIILNN